VLRFPDAIAGGQDCEYIANTMRSHPRPRQHTGLTRSSASSQNALQWFYSTRTADRTCVTARRVFTHSYVLTTTTERDWKQNKPFPLTSWGAEELAKMPQVLHHGSRQGDAETVAAEHPLTPKSQRAPGYQRMSFECIALSLPEQDSRAVCSGTAI